jgi:hypothetical protein
MGAHKEHKFEPYFYNRYLNDGKYDIPVIVRQDIDLDDLKLIRFSNIVKNETKDLDATVHFYEYDNQFDEVWKAPKDYLDEIGQYKQTISTDFSLYTNMSLALQIYNTYRNRWLGAYWQEHGIKVIPSVNWSDEQSFDFCFDGIEANSIVSVSTLGCRDNQEKYMTGFKAMCDKIRPELVICYAGLFDGMTELAPVIDIPYTANMRTSAAIQEKR